MKPRGPLMIEHRLIEKMLRLASREAESIKNSGKADPVFIDTCVDFIRTYADRTHHGKEEDILFKQLAAKPLKAQDKEMMQALVEEHQLARGAVRTLVKATAAYAGGQLAAMGLIIEKLEWLVQFYPEHIRKEDKVFFPATEKYFQPAELDAMLDAFWEFDRRMIHEKYERTVEEASRRFGG